MEVLECDSGSVKIYIAGECSLARQICQKFVERGACVNVVYTDYIYKYGKEQGVIVEFINYPRFPKSAVELIDAAQELGGLLLKGLCAGSYTITSSGWKDPKCNKSGFYSRREGD